MFTSHWRKKFLIERLGVNPDCCDFNRLLANAYCGAFQSTTVCHSFAKIGQFSFNRDALSDEAVGPSLVTESKDPNDNEAGMTSGDNKQIQRCHQGYASVACKQITTWISLAKVFWLSWQAIQCTLSVSIIKGGGNEIMVTLVFHVEDCIHMTLRRKMALNGSRIDIVEYCITQHAKKLGVNVTGCVMVVRIQMTMNNHAVCIQQDNTGNLYH